MKNITNKSVANTSSDILALVASVTLVISSVLLTSFAVKADTQTNQEASITQASGQVEKNSESTPTATKATKTTTTTQAAKDTVSDNAVEESATVAVTASETSGKVEKGTQSDTKADTKSDTKADIKVVDENGESFCFGNCNDDDSHHSHHCEDDDDDDCSKVYRFFENRRDGFYVDASAISSFGNDYGFDENQNTQSEFKTAISYRVQLLGLFMESPGISTRRIQGMYSMPAWGLNFYNSEDYSFDLFYQYSTRGIQGLNAIQTRNEDVRGGFRATGFYDNSQLQFIYSPFSHNKEGSDGIESSLSYSYNLQYRNVNYYTNLGLQYRSQEVTAYGQPKVYDDLSFSDGINYSAEIGVEYPLTTHWVVAGFAGYNKLSNRSVAARQDTVENGYRAGLLLTFVF